MSPPSDKTSTNSAAAISLKGLLNLDKAETVFQQLLDLVEAHSKELVSLRAEVCKRATNEELKTMCCEMEQQLRGQEQRIDALERAIQLPSAAVRLGGAGRRVGGDPQAREGVGAVEEGSGTIGECVDSTRCALKKALTILASKADRHEVEEEMTDIRHCIRAEAQQLRKWGVEREFADALGESQRGMGQQMAAVQTLLATKLDKTELSHVRSAVSKVQSVSAFLDDTGNRVGALEVHMSNTQSELRAHEKEHTQTSQRVESIEEQLQHRTASLEAHEGLCAVVEHHRGNVEQLATHVTAEYTALSERADTRDAQLGAMEDEHEARLEAVEAGVAGAATRQDMAKKADAAICDAMWGELKEEVATKALGEDLHDLDERVRKLCEAHGVTAKQAAIALKFVDWFSARGEAYEHNLNAVERQVEAMAIDALQSREPHDGRVRFVPS